MFRTGKWQPKQLWQRTMCWWNVHDRHGIWNWSKEAKIISISERYRTVSIFSWLYPQVQEQCLSHSICLNVLLAFGKVIGNSPYSPGWFRLCYLFFPSDTLQPASRIWFRWGDIKRYVWQETRAQVGHWENGEEICLFQREIVLFCFVFFLRKEKYV